MGTAGGAADAPAPITGPAPGDRALHAMVECRTSRSPIHGEPHAVIIRPDWSVQLPHDLDAERVAVAFGGYTSCLELVDVAVPALRRAIERLTRQESLPIRRDKRGDWRILPAQQFPDCCGRVAFPSIEAAAKHLHGAGHLARQHSAPEWQLTALLSAAERAWAWDEAPRAGAQGARRLVREEGGVADLWRAGIRPDQLPGIAAAVPAVTEPLPVSFYLGMVYAGADPEWMSEVTAHRPDGDTAAWLACVDSPAAGRDAALWGAWLDLGVHRDGVRVAVEHGLDPGRAREVASATGRNVGIVARDIVRWALAGCEPTAEHFALLARHGLEYSYPTAGGVDRLVAEAERRGLGHGVSRTDLAVMLMVHGTQPAVLATLAARAGRLARLTEKASRAPRDAAIGPAPGE